MSGRFEGRRVLVTGAAGGVGSDLVASFREEGATVVGTDVTGDDVLVADLTDPAQRDAVVEQTLAELGGLDVLCNVAGIQLFRKAEELDDEFVMRHLTINTLVPVMLSTRCLPALRESGGNIVTVSSISGVTSQPYNAAYCASKAGVTLAMKSLAVELASQGVRVNTVAPGGIETPLVAGSAASVPEDADWKLLHARSVGVMPGMSPAHHISQAIMFLASDEAASITGSQLVVDRGTLV